MYKVLLLNNDNFLDFASWETKINLDSSRRQSQKT